jgi:hypothetical protein
MAESQWDAVYSKKEPTPLSRFKNKNKILKAFGPDGVRVYDEIDGTRTARMVCDAAGVSEELFLRIISQLINDDAIEIVSEGNKSQQGQSVSLSSLTAASAEPAEPTSFEPQPPSWSLSSKSKSQQPISQKASQAAKEAGQIEAEAKSLQAKDSSATSLQSPPNLSPLEKLIFEKYGQVGLRVYELIDGERTAEDILNETGLSESKLVEILEFMNEQGIIKLDRPLRAPTSPSMPPQAALASERSKQGSSSPSDESIGFKPIVEKLDESDAAPLSPDALPVDVPVPPAHPSILQKAQMTAIISAKHGKVGHDLLEHIDGNKDFVQLSIETGLSLRDLDIMLADLGKAGLLSFKPLTRTEIRHRYGDDGLAIYKRYGRDGLLIYQMIGKVESLREIVRRSHIPPERAVDIIIFIHRVLGLELPVDRDMIYRYLTKG